MRFVRSFFWESLQNVPVIVGFLVSLRLWRQGDQAIAVACGVAGAVASVLIIYLTESKIVQGHREPLRVVMANCAVMSALVLLLAAYLTASWGSWMMDLFLGVVAGVLMGVAQDLAAREPVGVVHSVALGGSGALALIGIRMMILASLWMSIPVITVVVTLIITWIDYGTQL